MWRRLCAVTILAGAAALWISFEPFWSRQYYNAVSLFLLLLLAMALWRISAAISISGALIVLAGNHPGGRTQEMWDIVLLVLLGACMFRNSAAEPEANAPRARFTGSRFTAWWLAFLAAGAASIIASAQWISLSGYKLDAFYFLSSAEHQPHYPFRMLWWICLTGALIHLSGPRNFARSFGLGLIAAFSAASGLAIVEAVTPGLRPALDSIHVSIDGYVEYSPQRGIWQTLGGKAASNSFFWNRTWFAAFLSAAWGIAGWRLEKRRTRWLLIPLLLLAVTASGSRAGILACTAGTLALGWMHVMRHRSWLGHIPFALAFIFQIISPTFVLRPELLAERAVQFQTAIDIFGQFPVFGAGIESYASAAAAGRPIFSQTGLYGSAHNQVLQILSGMGVVGGIIYAGAIIAAYRHASSPWLRAGLITICIHSAFQEFWYVPAVHLCWWTLLAACLRHEAKPNLKLIGLPAAVLLACAALMHAFSRPLELMQLASFPATEGILSWTESAGSTKLSGPSLAQPSILGGYALVVPGHAFMLGEDKYEIQPLFYGAQRFPVRAEIEIYGQGSRRFLLVRCVPPAGYVRKGDRRPEEPCFWLSRSKAPPL